MWKVTPPNETVSAVLQLCVGNVREQDLKDRLSGISDALMAASAQFVTALETGTVHEFPQSETVEGASKAELIWLYDSKMAAPKAPAREIYDRLKMAARDGRCPLCGRGVVSTLDHHLPKTRFVNLTIAPMNLIPACQDCNKNKAQKIAEAAFEASLHPYTDDVDGQIWLRARIVEVSPPALFFFADPPTTWDRTLRDRVRSHFRMYKLRSVYATEGATLISNVQDFLAGHVARGGPQAIRAHATAMASSCRNKNMNSWQAAAYTGMAESDWFCSGGYALKG